VLVLDVSQLLYASVYSRYPPDGGLIYEELGAGDPVGAGADGSRSS
jgi:hypothetical protein